MWEPLTLQAERFGGWSAVPLDVTELDEQAEKQAELLAEHGARIARAQGYDARGISVADTEDVAGTILATVDELEVDLIVLGARGLAGVRAFLGACRTMSSSTRIARVLVLPVKSTS